MLHWKLKSLEHSSELMILVESMFSDEKENLKFIPNFFVHKIYWNSKLINL